MSGHKQVCESWLLEKKQRGEVGVIMNIQKKQSFKNARVGSSMT